MYEHGNKRLEHIRDLYEAPSLSSTKYTNWSKIRLQRMLVDYLLRQGHSETAGALAKKKDIEGLVDTELFSRCQAIRDSLLRQSTVECLSWCHENKLGGKKKEVRGRHKPALSPPSPYHPPADFLARTTSNSNCAYSSTSSSSAPATGPRSSKPAPTPRHTSTRNAPTPPHAWPPPPACSPTRPTPPASPPGPCTRPSAGSSWPTSSSAPIMRCTRSRPGRRCTWRSRRGCPPSRRPCVMRKRAAVARMSARTGRRRCVRSARPS